MSLLIAAAGGTPSARSHIERHTLFGLEWFNNHLLMSVLASGIAIAVLFMVAKSMQPRPVKAQRATSPRDVSAGSLN